MTFTLDDKYEDVDFTKDPNFVFGDIQSPAFDTEFGVYEDSNSVMSESELREAAERQLEQGGAEEYVTRIYNQGKEGACVANASCQAHEIIQAKTFGLDNVIPLSSISLYKQIGRSASSGAMVSDGMKVMKSLGALPLDTPGNREKFGSVVMPNRGFRERYPSNWKETAKQFQIVEAHVVRSVEGILTALARQQPVIVGREGHSICYCCLRYDRNWKTVYANSWGSKWGFGIGNFNGGFGTDTIGKIKKSARWAYVVRTIRAKQESLL